MIKCNYFSIGFLLMFISQICLSFPHDREVWIKDNLEAIVFAMCDKKSYFRQCFLVDDKKCKIVARISISRCMDEYRTLMPKTLEIPFDDEKYRPLIGACSGGQYQARLKNFSKNESICSGEGKWER
ncbi:MAG: hypothetical protein QM538_02505 [Methylacidiphilales bacterium]|nr:hypothetical protein [Candidatus Methylacidiphilales bacterium]